MTRQKINRVCWIGFILLLAVRTELPAQQAITIDQRMVPTASISDSTLIDFFLQEFLIPETGVEKIQFIDATGNGFGEEDLIKCFPSEKIYFQTPSDTAQKVMHNWVFTSNFQSVTQNKPPEVFEALPREKAQNWILAGLLRSVNWNYGDLPMKMYFERDSTTMTFEMWSYNPVALRWKPPPPPKRVPETTYDIIHVLRSDTLYVADTTYYDQFYIYREVSDTLFISKDELPPRSGRQNPKRHLPGLVPGRGAGRKK